MEIALGHINVNIICAKISFEYGNKICNEFSQLKDWRMEIFVLKWTNYVYGKDVANIIHKKISPWQFKIKLKKKSEKREKELKR
jgi:hypothetical protein